MIVIIFFQLILCLYYKVQVIFMPTERYVREFKDDQPPNHNDHPNPPKSRA